MMMAMSNATTAEPTLPPLPDELEPAPRRRRRLWYWVGGAVFVVVGVVVASLFVQVPYYTLSPGSVWPTEDLIAVNGAESFAADSEGQVGFTTVSLKHASAFEALLGWADPSVDVVDEDVILGGQS